MTRFKSTDDLGNVAYVHKCGDDWRCTLANGIPAAFFYAVGICDEMGLRFSLADAKHDHERLLILQKIAGPRRKIEFC